MGPVIKPIELLVADKNDNAPKAGKLISFSAPVALAA